ncbi:glycine cleavage system aminomethyltransferase GcvT [Alkalicoccus luteus]|uniref:Aminomethyltransferase n=1 Tax=Alkalicoccus luteus TaxID=1237094 RepID=A0A969PSM8_9BACI|nr:glycine cleavage system aminomethyltransferase GcvT [Alkalicoccus luteus]NJP37651.1 glycine cleavage system aminomethyltransferase GcvT [Alkalicoccus luteus]
MGKRTPLYERYAVYGAKTIDFGGWDLPVQFSSIKEEHEAVRSKVGLFDVSHMGEIRVTGKGTMDFLQKVLTNNVEKAADGQCQYTAMCYEDGGTVDDLVIYRFSSENVLLVVNAANIEKDEEWLRKHADDRVTITNESAETAQLALQGPMAQELLQKLSDTDLSEISFFRFREVRIDGINAVVSRTGYTGEDGFEIYLHKNEAAGLWDKLIEEGAAPIGLGARDTLRFEAKLALYGQELSADITPIEAGIGFAVNADKPADFLGKETLQKQKADGPPRKLVGIEMIDKGIPRHGYQVFGNEEEIGFITSGTQSPTLGKNVGLALLSADWTEIGTEVVVQVRKKRLQAVVVETPFYKRSKGGN